MPACTPALEGMLHRAERKPRAARTCSGTRGSTAKRRRHPVSASAVELKLEALVSSAATGSRSAADELRAVIWPMVVCRCRAECDADTADAVARQACESLLTALAGRSRSDTPVLRVLYEATSRAIAHTGTGVRAARMPHPLASLPAAEQDVLILRLIVGLDMEDTATSLARSPHTVRLDQHRALQRLRGMLGSRTW